MSFESPNVIGFDLGQHLGYFKGRAVGPVEFGTHQMPKTRDLGAWLAGCDGLLRKVLPGVDAVAVEMPFMGQDISPAIRLLGLMGHIAYMGRFYGIGESGFNRVPIATGKLTLSGFGHADADQMIAAAAREGYEGMNEHEAHACGVWKVIAIGAGETKAERDKRARLARRTTTP